jgi:hypothetical protein
MSVEKIAIICISSLFILLLALQFNIIWFTPSFAQLGGPDGDNNLNLSGRWERIDEYPSKDVYYINQEGTQITANAEPTGYCYEDINNPVEGTEFSQQKLEFRGNLTDNTIQGVRLLCFPETKTTGLLNLILTVSPDGRTLDGYATSPDGQQSITSRYVFVSDLPPVSIQINTDRPVYDLNEPVEISGQVTNMVANEESDVFIEVNGPDGLQAFTEAVAINSDGSFYTSINLDNQINKGTYTAKASHAGAIDDINFEVGTPPPPVAEIVIVSTIAAAGGGGVLLYKKGYLKGIKHGVKNTDEEVVEHHETKIDKPLPIIELRIECGLENSELIKRESRKNDNIITGNLTEVEQKFRQGINEILENRKKIKTIQKDIDFIKWCNKAKEDPNKILSKISEEVIGKFLTSIQPYFQNLMLSQIISVESDISVTEDRHKRIGRNITFSLNPIQAYIALVVYSNRAPISSTKFIFAINTYVKIKNLTISFEKVNRHQAQLKLPKLQVQHEDEETVKDYDSVIRRGIEIEDLLFGISVQFSKIEIGHSKKPIEPPIDLGKKELQIKKIILFFFS